MEFPNWVYHRVFGLVPPYQPKLMQHDRSDWSCSGFVYDWLQDASLHQVNIYKRSLVIKSKSHETSCCPRAFRHFWCALGVEVENILAFFYGRDNILGQARYTGFRAIGYHNGCPLEE